MTKCISHIVQLCRADVFIEKRVLYKMPSPMQMFVILTQAFSIAAQWIYRSYSAFSGSFDNRVAVAAFIGIRQSVSILPTSLQACVRPAIDTRCYKYSDRHTVHIHGKMYF